MIIVGLQLPLPKTHIHSSVLHLYVMTKVFKHTKSLMFPKLRLCVPALVLSITLTIAAASSSSLDSVSAQLWLTDPPYLAHVRVNQIIIVEDLTWVLEQ